MFDILVNAVLLRIFVRLSHLSAMTTVIQCIYTRKHGIFPLSHHNSQKVSTFIYSTSGYKCNTILLLHFCGDDGDDNAIKSAILSTAPLSIAPKSV